MLFKTISLEFFKGGSTTTTVNKRDPKTAEHVALDSSIYNILTPLAARYGGTSVAPNITTTTYSNPSSQPSRYVDEDGRYRTNNLSGNQQVTTSVQTQAPSLAAFNNSQLGKNFDMADIQSALANQNSLNLLKAVPQYLDQSNNALKQSELLANNYVNPYGNSDFDDYISKMGQMVDQSTRYATQYYDDADWYFAQNKDLSSRGTNEALENYMNEIYKSINSKFGDSAASLLNDAAGKGIINSSISHRGIAGLANAASSAAGEQYAGGFQALLNNYLQGAKTAGDLASNVVSNANTSTNNYKDVISSMLGVNENALNTMTGKANVLQGASQGYNRDYGSGLAGLDTFAKLPTAYYQNALAPVSPLYNYWKDMTDAYYGHEDYDHIVSSNGK